MASVAPSPQCVETCGARAAGFWADGWWKTHRGVAASAAARSGSAGVVLRGSPPRRRRGTASRPAPCRAPRTGPRATTGRPRAAWRVWPVRAGGGSAPGRPGCHPAQPQRRRLLRRARPDLRPPVHPVRPAHPAPGMGGGSSFRRRADLRPHRIRNLGSALQRSPPASSRDARDACNGHVGARRPGQRAHAERP